MLTLRMYIFIYVHLRIFCIYIHTCIYVLSSLIYIHTIPPPSRPPFSLLLHHVLASVSISPGQATMEIKRSSWSREGDGGEGGGLIREVSVCVATEGECTSQIQLDLDCSLSVSSVSLAL